MSTIELSLLREKIVVSDAGDGSIELASCLSNRISITLSSGDGKQKEKFIVRAHTMHLCTRFAAGILQEFQSRGFLANRLRDYQWNELWAQSCGTHDVAYNPDRWACVYHKGKSVFQTLEKNNALMDAIELRHASSSSTYDQVIFLIQDVFEKSGKSVSIDYDANIGLVCNLANDKTRCSIILRGSGRTTTFNFTATPNDEHDGKINMPQCLISCAAFLEGIQLSYIVGIVSAKLERGKIQSSDDASRKANAARKHLLSLSREVGVMERTMHIRYRPERPEFQKIIVDVQQQILRSLRR